MTSVKEFEVLQPPGPDTAGVGAFHFTDRYSIFDWGEMPDRLDRKGAALCTMGAHTFERLEGAGIPTHYRGVGDPTAPVPLDEMPQPPRRMVIELTQTPPLPTATTGYDYEAYHAAGGTHHLVPLEIVYRNAIPPTSSVRSRLTPAEVGLEGAEWPAETVVLDTPLVEFSTKFEPTDRYLTHTEATRVAGPASLDTLEAVALEVNRTVTAIATEAGFDHLDGKIECLYAAGEIRVADVAGTFDENRFRFDGFPVSKEVLRMFYRQNAPEWVDAIGAAKRSGHADWQAAVEVAPPPLPVGVKAAVERLYQSGVDRYCGSTQFDVGDLPMAIDQLRSLTDGQNS